MNLSSMFAEAVHVWYLCIISNSSNAYANFYDEKKRHYVTCCHVSAHVLPRQRPRNAYQPNTCQPTSPTHVNLRAQHVSIKEPNTCQSTSHTRVNLVTIHVYAASRLKQFSDGEKIVMDVTISMTKYTKSSRCNSYDATKMTKTISSQHRHKYMSMTFLAFTMTKVDCLGCGLFQQCAVQRQHNNYYNLGVQVKKARAANPYAWLNDRGIDYRFWSLFQFDFYKTMILAKEKNIVQMKYID